MTTILVLGRWLYSAIFIMTGFTHFQPGTIAYGQSAGVDPWLTMASGTLACLGGLSVALGYRARVGAWFIVAFLVPVTMTMHRFWGLDDPQLAMQQWSAFIKNASLLGAALIVAVLGSGPGSLDERLLAARRRRQPERAPAPAMTL
jgi:putative oxidoreductase